MAKLKVRARDGEAAPRWCCGADGGSRDVCEARARDDAAVPPVVVVPTAGRAVRARSRIHERTSVLHPRHACGPRQLARRAAARQVLEMKLERLDHAILNLDKTLALFAGP